MERSLFIGGQSLFGQSGDSVKTPIGNRYTYHSFRNAFIFGYQREVTFVSWLSRQYWLPYQLFGFRIFGLLLLRNNSEGIL